MTINRSKRLPMPGVMEPASTIERRLNRQLKELEDQRKRTEEKEKKGPRTVGQMRQDSTISRAP